MTYLLVGTEIQWCLLDTLNRLTLFPYNNRANIRYVRCEELVIIHHRLGRRDIKISGSNL